MMDFRTTALGNTLSKHTPKRCLAQ